MSNRRVFIAVHGFQSAGPVAPGWYEPAEAIAALQRSRDWVIAQQEPPAPAASYETRGSGRLYHAQVASAATTSGPEGFAHVSRNGQSVIRLIVAPSFVSHWPGDRAEELPDYSVFHLPEHQLSLEVSRHVWAMFWLFDDRDKPYVVSLPSGVVSYLRAGDAP